MSKKYHELFACPECKGPVLWNDDSVACGDCHASFRIIEDIPRFVNSLTHENFHIQWRTFSGVQLDSINGTTCSRDRLLDQSSLKPEDFYGKKVLEVGCGAGRFTEILTAFGADVVAIDYSRAVEVCAGSNNAARKAGKLFTAQADVFHLPFKSRSFDIVIGYGMLQHTGDAYRALECLWEKVRPGGLLLVDRYQLSLRSANPVKYISRPILKRLPAALALNFARKICSVMVPIQRFLLRRLVGDGYKKYFRFIINRSPNSTYPINLEIEGKLDADTAFKWSVLDTFDMWGPKYDMPQTFRAWKKDISSLEGGIVLKCGSCGQGNVGVVRRAP